MKILITGSSGYIGCHLIEFIHSVNKDIEIIEYDIKEGYDITDPDQLNEIFITARPDIVIHLAAISDIKSCEDMRITLSTNIIGTKNIINAMKLSGCNKIIYASSSSVYQSHNNLISEDDKKQPISNYGYSKLSAEMLIENSGINYIILRMFNVIGGNTSIFNNNRLLNSITTGNVTIYGSKYNTRDGTCERDYVSIYDVCRAYFRSIDYINKHISREIFNIGTSEGYTVLEIIEIYEKCNKCRINVREGDKRKGDPGKIIASISKASTILGWSPIESIDNTIMSIV